MTEVNGQPKEHPFITLDSLHTYLGTNYTYIGSIIVMQRFLQDLPPTYRSISQ